MMGTFWMLLGFFLLTASFAKQPNVIFIVSDDLGYDDLNFQSHQINTPNINYFVENGQFIEFHYVQMCCSPSRASLMTGRYPLHTGINDGIPPNDAWGVPLNNTLLPKLLYDAGYETHMVGKWHLGFYKWAYTPTFRGFKSYYGYYSGGEDYFTHKDGDYYDFRNDIGIECGRNCSQVAVNAYQNYSANLFSERAIEIITNHSTNDDTKDKPLFLYLAYQSVHAPPECPSYWVEPYEKTISDAKRRNFAGMCSVMDDGIGNITKTLRKFGYLENDGNTIIAFTSDNGAPTTTGDSVGGSNYPLRGGKWSIWEGGTRVTAWFYGTPDIVSPNLPTIGKNYTQLMHVVDWLPTILEAANVSHSFPPGLELDGVSHWSGLTSGNTYDDKYFKFRDNVYYGYDNGFRNVGYRYQWYKIFNSSGGSPSGWSPNDNASYPPNEYIGKENELLNVDPVLYDLNWKQRENVDAAKIPLYNISYDYSERHDISDSNQDLVNELLEKMHALQATANPQAHPDKNCPAIQHPKYPVVGQVWEPWC